MSNILSDDSNEARACLGLTTRVPRSYHARASVLSRACLCRTAVALILLLCFSTLTWAQNKAFVDYCEGELNEQAIMSQTGSKKTIHAAIRLTAEQLRPYIGCKITQVQAGISPKAESMPETLRGWIRINNNKADAQAVSEEIPTTGGWNELTLTQPYTITGEEQSIWVGYQFYQTSPIKCITFGGPAHEEAVYLGRETKLTTGAIQLTWSSMASQISSSLCIRAVVEGKLPQHNLTLESARLTRSINQLGQDIEVVGTIRNNAQVTATNPVIRYSLNGKEIGKYTYSGALAYNKRAEYHLSIPTTSLKYQAMTTVSLSLEWADGSADEDATDNTATLQSDMLSRVFQRRMVVEEGTGTWCQWCVRGYVGMKEMKAKYPDNFIGIAVHNGDAMTYRSYDSLMVHRIEGFPSCLINRDGRVYDPNFALLDAYMQQLDQASTAQITLSAGLDGENILMQSCVELSRATDHLLRVAYVILEDGIEAVQANAYAGGGNGEMGGFEKFGTRVQVPMYDVARYISAPEGNVGSLPASLRVGQQYWNTFSCSADKQGFVINDYSKVSVVALLIDTTTGEILNADRVEHLGTATAIDELPASSLLEVAPVDEACYDLLGRRISRPAHGLYIQGGRKHLVR